MPQTLFQSVRVTHSLLHLFLRLLELCELRGQLVVLRDETSHGLDSTSQVATSAFQAILDFRQGSLVSRVHHVPEQGLSVRMLRFKRRHDVLNGCVDSRRWCWNG